MPLSATNLIYNYIYGQPYIQAPSDEGAVERSETEGEKAIKIKFSLSLPQSFFLRKTTAPSSEGAFSDNRKGCPYGRAKILIPFHIIYHRSQPAHITIKL